MLPVFVSAVCVSIYILLFVFVIVVCVCVCAASAFVASIPRGCLSLFFGCVFVLSACASTHSVASLLISPRVVCVCIRVSVM